MFGILKSFGVAFSLLGSSIRVLWKHPKLVILPVLSAIVSIGYFFGALVGVPSGLIQSDAVALGFLVLLFGGTTFIASFFNATLVYCAARAFNGQEPSILEGMAAAWDNKGLLAAWALVATVVGFALRSIEETSDLLGRVVAWVVGAAWAFMTFFVVPVIVFEDTSLRGMFSRSSGLIKETWSESFVATGALSVIVFITVLSGSLVGIITGTTLLGLFAGPLPGSLAIFGSLLPPLLLAVVGYFVGSTLASISKAALYVYASQGVIPSEFRSTGELFE